MSSSSHASPDALGILRRYGACDISDALLKLKVPGAGFLPDLIPYCDQVSQDGTSRLQPILVAPASTVLFIPKNDSGSAFPPSNIPAGAHWVDLTQPKTIAILSQPEGQKNAVLGGIMAHRMKKLNAVGVVVHGRIRDIEELKGTELMVSQCWFRTERPRLTSYLPALDLGQRYFYSRSWCRKQAICYQCSDHDLRHYHHTRRSRLQRSCKWCCHHSTVEN